VLIGTVALIAAATKRGDLVPVLIVLALVGFIGSVSIARFAAAESAEEGRILTKDELEDILSQRDAAHEDGPGADEDEDSGSVIVSVEADDDEEHRRRDR